VIQYSQAKKGSSRRGEHAADLRATTGVGDRTRIKRMRKTFIVTRVMIKVFFYNGAPEKKGKKYGLFG